jgi:acetyl esterase/lipase
MEFKRRSPVDIDIEFLVQLSRRILDLSNDTELVRCRVYHQSQQHGTESDTGNAAVSAPRDNDCQALSKVTGVNTQSDCVSDAVTTNTTTNDSVSVIESNSNSSIPKVVLDASASADRLVSSARRSPFFDVDIRSLLLNWASAVLPALFVLDSTKDKVQTKTQIHGSASTGTGTGIGTGIGIGASSGSNADAIAASTSGPGVAHRRHSTADFQWYDTTEPMSARSYIEDVTIQVPDTKVSPVTLRDQAAYELQHVHNTVRQTIAVLEQLQEQCTVDGHGELMGLDLGWFIPGARSLCDLTLDRQNYIANHCNGLREQIEQHPDAEHCNAVAVGLVLPLTYHFLFHLCATLLGTCERHDVQIPKSTDAEVSPLGGVHPEWLSPQDIQLLSIDQSKLELINKVLLLAAKFDPQEISLIPHRECLPFETRHTPTDMVALHEARNSFLDDVAVGASFVDTGMHYDDPFLSAWMTGMGMVYYGLDRDAAAARGELVNTHSRIEHQLKLWNMADNLAVARAMHNIVLESIAVNYIMDVVEPSHVFDDEADPNDAVVVRDPNETEMPLLHYIAEETTHPDTVPVRLLLSSTGKEAIEAISPHAFADGSSLPRSCGFVNSWMSSSSPNARPNPSQFMTPATTPALSAPAVDAVDGKSKPFGVVIHIHGGGWSAMSSASHQNYTRTWANMVDVPVLSIDYRLAPEFPFPAALNDCIRLYRWVVECSHLKFGQKPEKIVLVGDSAGGNLVAALTVHTVRCGYRRPDGCILVYPALHISSQVFSPSILQSLDDRLVPFSFLRGALSSYLGIDATDTTSAEFDAKIEKKCANELVSPGRTDDEVLAQFPPTRLMVGSFDPLHDSVVNFAERLSTLGRDVKLRVDEGMMHGYLNMDSVFFDRYKPLRNMSHECVMFAATWLQELLGR